MVQCLHGDGAKIVLSDPTGSVDDGATLGADVFTGEPTLAPLKITLIARADSYETTPQTFGPGARITAAFLSGYQRLAAAEADSRSASLAALARAFAADRPDTPPANDPLPAIYTYFGQFIAHETTRLEPVVGGTFKNINSSRFDLDSLFFADGSFTALVQNLAPPGESFGAAALGCTAPDTAPALADLPRAADGDPLVPDGRSDANPALSQLHVAILRKYRALLDLHDEAKARRKLRSLLHGITIHDYLKEIIDDCVYADVLASGRRLVNPQRVKPRYFLTPIEFAAGAFRFGHTMVRNGYRWSQTGLTRDAELPEMMLHTQLGGALEFDGPEGIRRLPSDWTMDPADMLRPAAGAAPNLACRIGPSLASGLWELSGKYVPNAGQVRVNLAERTLTRGVEVMLPSAQSLWRLIEPGCGRFLTPEEIAGPKGSAMHDALTQREPGQETLTERTPLWFYVLREAEVFSGGRRLGPLGGRIVMETIHAAIAATGTDLAALPQATLADLFDPNGI